MTVERLRPLPTPAELGRLYRTPHRHAQWRDHVLRVELTVQVARWLAPAAVSVADLSCGDAAITKALGLPETVLGDYAPGYQYCGPIEETIEQVEPVDLFVCSETIEHLDDPPAVLAQIRGKTRALVLSTPIGESFADGNTEHLWSWTVEDVGKLLADAGFRPEVTVPILLPSYLYDFQVWGCW